MRASALTLAAYCRASEGLNKKHNYGSQFSRVGTAFHEAAKSKVLKEEIKMDSIRTRYNLTDDEVKDIWIGIGNLQINIPEGASVWADDKELSALEGDLTGTPDLVIFHDKAMTIVDWKSGWGDVPDIENNYQILAYGLLALKNFIVGVETVHLMIVQPKLNIVKSKVYPMEDVFRFGEDISQIILEAEYTPENTPEYTTGPWCSTCYANMHCPAFTSGLKALVATDDQTIQTVSAIAKALPYVKALGIVTAKVDAAAKAWVDRHGPLALVDGSTYEKVIGEKDKVNPVETWPLLKDKIGVEATLNTISITKGKIKSTCAGIKRGLSVEVLKELTEAGAIEKVPSVTYKVIKGGKKDGKGLTDGGSTKERDTSSGGEGESNSKSS